MAINGVLCLKRFQLKALGLSSPPSLLSDILYKYIVSVDHALALEMAVSILSWSIEAKKERQSLIPSVVHTRFS